MQRILRWEVPVDDQWHDIGTGYVTHVASRTHRKQPGDLVEVWTLEDIQGDAMHDVTKLPLRKATAIGTGHKVPDRFVEHIGSAVVPTFHLDGQTGKAIRSTSGLVWHVFAQYDPATERQRLMEQGQRLASQADDLIAAGANPADLIPPMAPLGNHVNGIVRSAKVQTLEDEATSLAYWLANKLGEHVDDQDGETLTQTVGRLLARMVRYTHIAALPCPDCGQHKIIGYRLDDENGNNRHTHYVCRFWGADEPKACGWHGWSVPGWDAPEEATS